MVVSYRWGKFRQGIQRVNFILPLVFVYIVAVI